MYNIRPLPWKKRITLLAVCVLLALVFMKLRPPEEQLASMLFGSILIGGLLYSLIRLIDSWVFWKKND